MHHRARPVVHELRALVEERGVVFVGFDNEEPGVAEARRSAEVGGYAADQETGFEPGVLENPRQHARGRRLAVSACDGNDMTVPQHVLGEPLRARRDSVCSLSSIASTTSTPRLITLPTTTQSGFGLELRRLRTPSMNVDTETGFNCVLIGG